MADNPEPKVMQIQPGPGSSFGNGGRVAKDMQDEGTKTIRSTSTWLVGRLFIALLNLFLRRSRSESDSQIPWQLGQAPPHRPQRPSPYPSRANHQHAFARNSVKSLGGRPPDYAEQVRSLSLRQVFPLPHLQSVDRDVHDADAMGDHPVAQGLCHAPDRQLRPG
ncbi:MAG: hypothetical protein U0361_20285 [Nitrospiraceae bacterium]